MDLHCPQCNVSLTASFSSARLVQDACGHKKCRLCLLQDEFECRSCPKPKAEHVNKDKIDNHTAVIMQNIAVNDVKHSKSKAVKKRSYKFVTIPNHILTIPGNPTLYKCKMCMKSFRSKYHIQYHSYCAGGEKPLRCDKCCKEFVTKYHLQTHIMGHMDRKKYVCNICNKSFHSNSKLSNHKLVHSEVKRFVCQQCGKMFKTRDSLRKHNTIHSAVKSFACQKCNAQFRNSANLNQHQVVHTKEKVHMCDECGKRFKSKITLKIHLRSHTSRKALKCHMCSKVFLAKKELHRHQLVHSDVKPYACSLCGTSFRRKDNVQRHARNAHPGVKPIVIKKQLKPRPMKQKIDKPQEYPNAINVITAPPSVHVSSSTSTPVLSKPVQVINAPLKLAFKTTAFKSNYNIHSREYIDPSRIQSKYDYEESLSICQKILQPSNTSPSSSRTIIKTLGNISEKDSNEICHKILAPIVPPVVIDTSYSIRNIKFKLPDKYIDLSKKNILNDLNILKPVETSDVHVDSTESTYTELKTVQPINGATSVIVNPYSAYPQNEMHWRRRTLQNLELNIKNEADSA